MTVTLLLAGHETTATTLAWGLQYVLTHPDVYARVRALAWSRHQCAYGATSTPRQNAYQPRISSAAAFGSG
jgi:cytochrome P450